METAYPLFSFPCQLVYDSRESKWKEQREVTFIVRYVYRSRLIHENLTHKIKDLERNTKVFTTLCKFENHLSSLLDNWTYTPL